MVYCGKPSRGCQNCKTRRIKCDEIRPVCTQCQKSNRVCPGYPDEFDLIFRNETIAVQRRAQRAASSTSAPTKKNNKTSPGLTKKERTPSTSPVDTTLSWCSSTSNNSPKSESSYYDDSTQLIRRDARPPRTVYPTYDPPVESVVDQIEEAALSEMSPDLDEPFTPTIEFNSYTSLPMNLTFSRELASTSFFLKNFAASTREKDSIRGYLEILLPIYQNTSADSLVHQATTAVALASLSNSFKTRLLRVEAQKLYGKALREVGIAIKDPTLARSDELLMSILLFSLYETITATNESRASWTHHISGAVSLVKLRGEEQLKNPQSLHLFRAVRASMLTSSIIQGKTIEDFPAPGGWSCDNNGDLNAANRLTLICLKLPNIKAYAQKLLAQAKTSTVVNEMISLIKTVKEIDSQLEHWALTVPEEWSYTTVEYCREEPKDLTNSQFWQGPIHVYHDLSVANITNDYRISRIFCQAVIMGCISALPPHAQTERTERVSAQAAYVTQQMVDDFCSSIPFLLGYNVQGTARAIGITEGSAKAMGAYFAVWPLFVTKKISCISGRQRKWLEGRLHYIGKTFGLDEEEVLSFAKRHVLTSGPSFSPTLPSCVTNHDIHDRILDLETPIVQGIT